MSSALNKPFPYLKTCERTMDRRHFIARAAAGALALGLPGAAWRTGPSAHLQTLARPALLDMLGDRRVRGLGMHYREMHPMERDADILSAAILSSDMPPLTNGRTLRAHLKTTIRSDFAAGRTVLLKGWVLSVAEARQCALFSLVYP